MNGMSFIKKKGTVRSIEVIYLWQLVLPVLCIKFRSIDIPMIWRFPSFFFNLKSEISSGNRIYNEFRVSIITDGVH